MSEKTRADYIFENMEQFACFWSGLGGDAEASIEISEQFFNTLVDEFRGGNWTRIAIDNELKTLTIKVVGHTFNFKAKVKDEDETTD